MTKYYHLNIYKPSFALLLELSRLTAKFERSYRFTLGEKINNAIFNLILLIYKANAARVLDLRIRYIDEMGECLQLLVVCLKMAYELRCISKNKYIELAAILDEIEKQLCGWMKFTKNKRDEVLIFR